MLQVLNPNIANCLVHVVTDNSSRAEGFLVDFSACSRISGRAATWPPARSYARIPENQTTVVGRSVPHPPWQNSSQNPPSNIYMQSSASGIGFSNSEIPSRECYTGVSVNSQFASDPEFSQQNTKQYIELDHSGAYDSSLQHMHWSLQCPFLSGYHGSLLVLGNSKFNKLEYAGQEGDFVLFWDKPIPAHWLLVCIFLRLQGNFRQGVISFSTNQLFASLKLSARNCTRTLAIMGSRAILPESGHYALNFICKQWSLFKHVLHFRFPFFHIFPRKSCEKPTFSFL